MADYINTSQYWGNSYWGGSYWGLISTVVFDFAEHYDLDVILNRTLAFSLVMNQTLNFSPILNRTLAFSLVMNQTLNFSPILNRTLDFTYEELQDL